MRWRGVGGPSRAADGHCGASEGEFVCARCCVGAALSCRSSPFDASWRGSCVVPEGGPLGGFCAFARLCQPCSASLEVSIKNYHVALAQLGERWPFKPVVVGSIPTRSVLRYGVNSNIATFHVAVTGAVPVIEAWQQQRARVPDRGLRRTTTHNGVRLHSHAMTLRPSESARPARHIVLNRTSAGRDGGHCE